MEETGKLTMFLTVKANFIQFDESQKNPRICLAFREVGADASSNWDIV